MFKHSLTLAIRTLMRYKSVFLINMIGLSTGLAGALLIYLWVYDEMSFDKFHSESDRIYQVIQNQENANGIITLEETPGLLARSLKREMPEVALASSVVPSTWFSSQGVINVGETNIKASPQFVEPAYFDIFSYPILSGNRAELLADKKYVLISDELAEKLFGTTNGVVGKQVKWKRRKFSGDYMVSGVFQKPPTNSSDQFDMIFSYELFLDNYAHLNDWRNSDPYTVLLLSKTGDPGKLGSKIENYLHDKNPESKQTLLLRKHSDKYLYGQYENGVQAGGRIVYVKLFSLIAIFILIIASVNFMNLSTARASHRMKEVGVKKALGSRRRTLVTQYLSESVMVTLLSLILAFLFVWLLLPSFNAITGKSLTLLFTPELVGVYLTITILTGVFAGSYPALYLSGFKPAVVLKGKLKSSVIELLTRKGLVVLQFVVSVTLIVSVWIIYEQVDYVQSKNLGYNRDNIIVFGKEGKVRQNLQAFLIEAKKVPGVLEVSNMGGEITGDYGTTGNVTWPGKNEEDKISFGNLGVNFDLIETLDIQMVKGRAFSRDYGSDAAGLIFNESAIKAMGLRNPVGRNVTLWGKEHKIIGVMKDFHVESLHEPVRPFFFRLAPKGSKIMVRIAGETTRETLDQFRDFYEAFNDGIPLEYTFLDDKYKTLYVAEQRVGVLSSYFAGIAILISCLGLFGLAAFNAERRMKEIGIRKILGSSEINIIAMLSSELTKMVGLSLLIALPLSFFLAKGWLDSFAYRIGLDWWYFIVTAAATMAVAWLTIVYQMYKSSRINPLDCIKDE